jgi:predicted metal-dependent hydrolase
MKHLTILGQQHILREQKSDKDHIEHRSNTIIVNKHKKTTKTLLKEFLAQLLYDKLLEIYDSIKAEGKVELFGDFDFEITQNIDRKRQRIAKIKGSKVLVKLGAVALPEGILRYVIAHEIAHITSKRHTRRFWKTVELIYPDYVRAQELLTEYAKSVTVLVSSSESQC